MSRRLYLAFAHNEPPNDGLFIRLQRAMMGPLDHAEFVFREGKTMVRYIVAPPSKFHDACVFKTKLRFDARTDWRYLRLLLEDAKIDAILIFLEEAIAKRHFFTHAHMLEASGIVFPEFIWWLILGPEAPVENAGEPLFCTELCLLALQHVGLLEHYPADRCSPNDLYYMAQEFSEQALFEPPLGIDSLGLPVSEESYSVYTA